MVITIHCSIRYCFPMVNEWHCGIQKVNPLGASYSRQKYCEHELLPTVTNMTTIDEFLDIEVEAMQKEKCKK